MTDPRTNPEFKRLRQEERVIAMLGAILDALIKPEPLPKIDAPTVRNTRSRSEK